MLGTAFAVVAVLAQVEVVEEPNAHLTVMCQTKGTKVLIDGTEVGEVNRRLGIVAGERHLTLVRDGCWDVHYDLTIRKGQNARLRIRRMLTGVNLSDSRYSVASLHTQMLGVRGTPKNYTIKRTANKIRAEGRPFEGHGLHVYAYDFRKWRHFVVRLEYIIDRGSQITGAGFFGWKGASPVIDGRPHTVIVVVGPDRGFAIHDYKKVVRDTSLRGNDICTLGVGYDGKSKARGAFTLQNFFARELTEEEFTRLAKAYGVIKK